MSDVGAFLNDSDYESHPSFKFASVGDKIVGEIVAEPRLVETDDLNGGRSTKLVVDIRHTDGETYSVWVKKGLMAKAISEALKAAGQTELTEGGTLALEHSGLGTPSKPGFSPPKLWQAGYKPPAGGVAVDDIFAD